MIDHLHCSCSSGPWTRMDVCLAFTFHLIHSLLSSRVGLIRGRLSILLIRVLLPSLKLLPCPNATVRVLLNSTKW